MDNPQAFPCLDSNEYGLCMRDPGMTLRDWFAGQALIGMHNESPWDAASSAYEYADAMLEARTPKGDE